MSLPSHKRLSLLACAVLGTLLFTGCGQHITFEKVDLRGHVKVKGAGKDEGYCFRVPSKWEIREKLEGADVVCLSPPIKGQFRESVVARAVTAQDLKEPEALIKAELEKMGEKVEVVEPYTGGDAPMLVNLNDAKFSALPLSQLLFVHVKPEGGGVLICCTVEQANIAARRPELEAMVAKAKFTLAECPGAGGVPDTFPTPQVTLSPGPTTVVPAPAVATPAAPAAVVAPASPAPASVVAPATPPAATSAPAPTVQTPAAPASAATAAPAVKATPKKATP